MKTKKYGHNKKTDRNKALAKAAQEPGITLQSLGDQFGITSGRINKFIRWYATLRNDSVVVPMNFDGSWAVLIRRQY